MKNIILIPLIALFSLNSKAEIMDEIYLTANLGSSFLSWEELDGNSTYWSIGLGYELSQHLNFRIGYEDYGSVEGDWIPEPVAGIVSSHGAVEAQGIYAIYSPDIKITEKLTFSPKAGAVYMDSFARPDFYNDPETLYKDRDWALKLAIEGKYKVNEKINAGIEYNYINIDRINLASLSLSLQLEF